MPCIANPFPQLFITFPKIGKAGESPIINLLIVVIGMAIGQQQPGINPLSTKALTTGNPLAVIPLDPLIQKPILGPLQHSGLPKNKNLFVTVTSGFILSFQHYSRTL